MDKTRVAIIGTGIIAREHAKKYAAVDGATIVAACDILEEKLGAFCGEFGIECSYADYRKLLERDDVDAVDICVHNNLHAPLAIAALRSGKHCYCEKPLAGSYRDAKSIVDAAAETGKKLHVQLGTLYTNAARAAKLLIEGGCIGTPYHARSYGYRRRGRPFVDGYAEKEFCSKHHAGGGALYDMGVYHISEILHLLGCPKVSRVTGRVYQELTMDAKRKAESGFDVEELGCGFVSFEGGLTLDILEAWAINAGPFPPSMIAGTKGGLSLGDEPTLYGEAAGFPLTSKVDAAAELYRIRKSNPQAGFYAESQAHWIGALQGKCELLDTAGIALQTMLISEGIYMSSVLNREVTADEIVRESKPAYIRRQETPFGALEYE